MVSGSGSTFSEYLFGNLRCLGPPPGDRFLKQKIEEAQQGVGAIGRNELTYLKALFGESVGSIIGVKIADDISLSF